jgi:butyryl-CoA dehydrogenase
MGCAARPDGDELVITGSKTWISNARRSGLIALLCKTDPQATPRHTGISVVLVESPPGVPPAGLTISRDLPKLGYKGVESCELVFDGCRVPASAILGGEPGKGFAQMMKGLETRRQHWRTPWPTPRQGRVSEPRSGATRRWATTWPIWRRS